MDELLFSNDDYQPFSCPAHGSQLVLKASLKGERPKCRECQEPMFTIAETQRLKAPPADPPEPKKKGKGTKPEPQDWKLRLLHAIQRESTDTRKARKARLRIIRAHLEE